MSVPASQARHPPYLRLVRSSLQPGSPAEPDAGWRRVAASILTSTWNVSRFLHEQRWGRVHEEISERRELLGFMRSLPLDATGRAALRALDQAALESERAIAAMMGESR